MSFKLIKYISDKFSRGGTQRRFLNFARVVAFISVMLGTIALIISLSVLEGFDNMLRENAVRFTAHINIRAFDKEPFTNYDKTLDKIRSFPSVKAAAPALYNEGLIRAGGEIEGIVMRGVHPEKDITNISEKMITGDYSFSSPDAGEIILGKRLALRIGADSGDKVVIYSIKPEDMSSLPKAGISTFRVKGIYESGMAEYDGTVVFMPYQKALSLMKLPEGSATNYELILDDVTKAPMAAREMEIKLGYPHYALTVYDLHSAVFAWIELQKEPIPLVLGLISLVAAFNIITTLLITVVEKTKQIGIMRSLGLNGSLIMRLFIYRGVSLAAQASLTGMALALAFSILQNQFGLITLRGEVYFLDKLPVSIDPLHYLAVFGITLAFSFFATLIPAYVAVKVTPLKALRFS
ncbi:MAG: FtsX-like permease family protein [Candidatus Kapaibacterium sp.]